MIEEDLNGAIAKKQNKSKSRFFVCTMKSALQEFVL